MQKYTKQAAEKIIESRTKDFAVTNNGVWPVKTIESRCKEFASLEWKPCCEMDGPDAPDPLEAPSLPIPFTESQLAAFMLHGAGSYVLDVFGGWEDGPEKAALDGMGILANKAREAVQGAFDAYRAAVIIVGKFDKTLALHSQALEDEFYEKSVTATDKARLLEAQREADEYESAWRKRMVNQFL